ncbi:hypothetical protein HTV45_06180 [Streptomyces sp. CHD11]|uniref:DUF6343 family protein n=1 Tax=Streptomyces sp. CHD11 TaxID=2741325 RepID=UPI001BFCB276|nr:DUF6343 family protein [Streptomyces sp. CHD11]MBT3150479.1 hypothetical protein [Streptomyces sp. CHD11]
MREERTDRTGQRVPRSRSGAIGRRFPRTGTEPVTARSPLRLRLALAGIFLPLFVAGCALFAVWAANAGPGDSPGRGPLIFISAVCGFLALTAALDLAVVLRRLRRERDAGH